MTHNDGGSKRVLADRLRRIFDNQHLLDATEIFRKLNVHKKVCRTPEQRTKVRA